MLVDKCTNGGSFRMSKKICADSKSVGQLLGRYERRPVILPQFQRPYSWDKSKVQAFWNDISLFRPEFESSPTTASYYLGAIVVIDSDNELLLLDGQQRLATATILLSALRDKARQLATQGDKKGDDLARDIQRELIEKTDDPVSYSLTLGELDEEHFKKVIKIDGAPPHDAKLRSHQAIDNARAHFLEKITDAIDTLSVEAKLKRLKPIRDCLTNGLTLIEIQVPSEDDAVQIFETLNDRGLRLSVPDLVLNLLMKRAKTKEERKIVRDHWNQIIRILGRRDVARFLRHYWVSFYGDVKSQSLFSEIKNKLEQENMESVAFVEHCSEECDNYVALLDQNLKTDSGTHANLEGLIKYFDANNAMPLLLSGFTCLSSSDFSKLVKMAIATYIRYSLVLNKNPLELETAFYSVARTIRTAHRNNETSAKALSRSREIFQAIQVSNDDVAKAAATLELERSQAQWLLAHLANAMQTSTKEIGMASANLEHILPVNPAKEWGDVSDLKSLTWYLGNLTILGEKLNSGAQNKTFETKRDNFYAKSEIKMTQKLCDTKKWGGREIELRGAELGKEIARNWPTI